MTSTKNWWRGEIDWETPAGHLLRRFLALLPSDRPFRMTLFGSAPLQLTLDRTLLSADVDLFSNDDEDLQEMIRSFKMDREHGGNLFLEAGFELSFRTSPRWRDRARTFEFGSVHLTLPHPLDILIGKLDRLAPKDLEAFRRVIAATGHPTAEEMKRELQNAVDLFRPGFEEESPNRYQENTRQLWREIFHADIEVREEIIAPALARRQQGRGGSPPDYKSALGATAETRRGFGSARE